MTDVPEVTPEEASGLLASGAALVDVREDEEWALGHAEGARHLPLSSLADRLDEVPHDRTVVAICRTGGRSARVTEVLRARGVDCVNLAGGSRAWVEAGLPFVTDDGRPGRVE